MKRLAMALLLAAVTAAPLSAIPAFARRYRVPCSMCHDPIPRLNPYGEQFAANGYVMSEDDTTGTESHGDSLLRLNSTLPLAIRFDAYVRANGGQQVQWDFQTPVIAKLLSGGQVAKGVSYYIYLLLSEDGVTGPIEDAWLQFRKPVGLPADVTIGQFQLIDPLWKRELRITLEDYAILSYRAGQSAANLTYDRGLIVAGSPTSSTDVYGMLINGNGIDPAVNGSFDGDAPKTGSIMLTQQVGNFRLGALGYYGRQRMTPTGSSTSVDNLTRMVGPALVWQQGNVDLGGQYVYRDDSDPDFTGTNAFSTTRGGFAELNFWPQGRGHRLLVTGLYNWIDTSGPGADYETATANISWLYARNLRLAMEVTRDLVGNQTSLAFGVITAF